MHLQERWEEFLRREESERAKFFISNEKLRSVILTQQFNRPLLDYIFKIADVLRKIEDIKDGADYLKSLLSHKKALLYFVQPSTRTRLSFEAACHIMGIDTALVADVKTSSEYKGESPLDTVQTCSEYFDLVIMRHPEAGFVEKTAWHLLANTRRRNVPVINAGSSMDQHPTQALLDYYTIHRSLKSVDSKVITMVGDLRRGRTVRSLAYLARNYKGIKLNFCAPENFQMGSDILAYLDRHGIVYEKVRDFKSIIPKSDVVYMTRIQDEYEGGNEPKSYDEYSFNEDHLELLKHDAIVLHPLPRRAELSSKVDQDKRIRIWSQVRNGMWIRAALIALIFGADRKIKAKYPDLFLDEDYNFLS